MSDESEHLIEQEEALTMSMFANRRDLDAARIRQAAQMVIDEWTYAYISNQPMIDALVRLREALALPSTHGETPCSRGGKCPYGGACPDCSGARA